MPAQSPAWKPDAGGWWPEGESEPGLSGALQRIRTADISRDRGALWPAELAGHDLGLRGQARTGDPSLPKRVRSQLRYAESLLVGAVRFERTTSRRTAGLQPAAMSLSATLPCKQRIGCPLLSALPGGNDRHRTGNPLLARQVLSQLSYVPMSLMVGADGIEPPT
jgi:hypothetical protein